MLQLFVGFFDGFLAISILRSTWITLGFFQLLRSKWTKSDTESPAFERRKRSPKLRPGGSNGHGGPGLRYRDIHQGNQQ